MSLILECWEEELSDVQKKAKEKAQLEMKEFQRKIADVYDMVGNKSKNQVQVQAPVTVSTATPSASSNQQILLQVKDKNQATTQMNGGTYVIVDNNNQFKWVLPNGAIPPSQVVSPVVTNGTIRLPTTMPQFQTRPASELSRANATSGSAGTAKRVVFKPMPRSVVVPPVQSSVRMPVQPPPVKLTPAPAPSLKPFAAPAQQNNKSIFIPPSQKKAEPLNKGLPPKVPLWKRPITKRILNTDVVDLTSDDGIDDESNHIGGIVSHEGSSDEQEKTFPSLVVVARTFLSSKLLSGAEEKAARTQLDTKVKKILVLPPYNLVEHLIQQKIVKIKQRCRDHDVECQLGLLSEELRNQNSGGFVWVNPCCQQKTSIFSGSIFEGAPYPPVTILKLIYHWACQTSVQNVLHWVKVSNVYIKKMYTLLRSICVTTIHERFPILGGPGQIVEIGLISLGTGFQSGESVSKHVKVEVLGIYDVKKRLVRLKALDPMPDSEKYKRKKFIRCLEPLVEFIHKDSVIVTDICADDKAWNSVGFKNIQPSTVNGVNNKNVMNYIRTIVPRMFQNTLSLLSRQLIQQFFDELVWREAWGSGPLTAYNQIIDDIITLTALESETPLVKILIKIAMNPFKNWKFQNWAVNNSSMTETTNTIVNPGEASLFLEVTQGEGSSAEATTSSSADGRDGMVYLESYYYGSYESDVRPTKSSSLYTECAICLRDFRDNAQFADHLIFHALNKNYPGDNPRDLCRICLKVPDKGSMNAHVTQYHRDTADKSNFCKICNVPFRARPRLIEHMTSTHHELELPYTCEICYFRTSIFEAMQSHFSTVHKNMCCAQCPFCLKVVYFLNGLGEDITKNQMYFIKHIQRHQLPFAKKCPRCALSFHNSTILNDHLQRDHTACSTYQAIKRYPVVNGQGILMKRPLYTPKIQSKSKKDDEDVFISLGIIKGAIDPSYYANIEANYSFFRCKECDGPLSLKHLTKEPIACPDCHFKSNCLYNYSEHKILNHSEESYVKAIQWYKRSSTNVPRTSKPYHCSNCLMSNSDGNEIAHHLAFSCPGAFITTDKRKAQLSSGYFATTQDIELDLPTRKRKSKGGSVSGSKKRRRPNSIISDDSDNSSTASVYQEPVVPVPSVTENQTE